MYKKHLLSGFLLLMLTFLLLSFYPQKNTQKDASGKIKVALRQVGNQLLLSNNDSTSLVLPIKKKSTDIYEISFEKHLSFEPSLLVKYLRINLNKLSISKNYRVEVLENTNNEVVYSYEMNEDEEKTLIPCAGRVLPIKNYKIQIQFLEEESTSKNALFYFLIPIVLGVLFRVFFYKKKDKLYNNTNEKQAVVGSFIFYPEQNKLVKKAKEIALSKKECELLEIFIANANKVVKREELTKRVWEDNGVIVGRSLDTYISKLRKKLQEDESIKLINIHGVGYKLEVK